MQRRKPARPSPDRASGVYRVVRAAAIAALLATTGQGSSVRAADSGPRGAEVVLDNASVTVIRIRMAPHEQTPMHDLTARVVVWLTEARLVDTMASGETHDQQMKVGDVQWLPAQRHRGENLSDHPIEFIAIVPKGSGTNESAHEHH